MYENYIRLVLKNVKNAFVIKKNTIFVPNYS